MRLNEEDFTLYTLIPSPIAIVYYDFSIVFTNKSFLDFTTKSPFQPRQLTSSTEFMLFLEDQSKEKHNGTITNSGDCIQLVVSKIKITKAEKEIPALLITNIEINETLVLPDSDIEFLLLSHKGEIISKNTSATTNKVIIQLLESDIKSKILQEGGEITTEGVCFIKNYIFSDKDELDLEERKQNWYSLSVTKISRGYILECSDITQKELDRQELEQCKKRIQTTSVFISNLAHGMETFHLIIT